MRVPAFLLAAFGALFFNGHASFAETVILYNGPPPPEGGLAVNFTLPVIPAGQQLKVDFELHVSAFRAGDPGSTYNPFMIGVCFKPLDCAPDATAKIFANLAGVHMTLTPAFFHQTYGSFTQRNLQLFFAPTDGTIWDYNDNVRLVAHWDKPQ